MGEKEFEFKAFIFNKYYKAALVFIIGIFLIIGIPWGIIIEIFDEKLKQLSLLSLLLTYSVIVTPFTLIFFKLLFRFFYNKTTISIGNNNDIIIIKQTKKIIKIKNKSISKTIIRNNDNTSLKNKYKTIELVWDENKSLKIVSKKTNQESIFNDFIEYYLLFFDLNLDSFEKKTINKQGDYKLTYNH